MECSSGAVSTVCDIQVDGRPGAERPKQTWKKLTENTNDCYHIRTIPTKFGQNPASSLGGEVV